MMHTTVAQNVGGLLYAVALGVGHHGGHGTPVTALGIMIKINIPKVRKTICKQTLPCIMLIGWGGEPQLPA
jgi:hypothetical protein